MVVDLFTVLSSSRLINIVCFYVPTIHPGGIYHLSDGIVKYRRYNTVIMRTTERTTSPRCFTRNKLKYGSVCATHRC